MKTREAKRKLSHLKKEGAALQLQALICLQQARAKIQQAIDLITIEVSWTRIKKK